MKTKTADEKALQTLRDYCERYARNRPFQAPETPVFTAHEIRRIQGAIRGAYAEARLLIAGARDCQTNGYELGVKAALERIAEIRRINADRRRALRAGRRI